MGRVFSIMIVDDEPNVRLMIRTSLESVSYRVVEAEDGEQALDRLRKSRVDLILLDLRMPLLDGMETLRHLREIGDKTPVVMVTAHGSIADAVAAVKVGAIDFLAKPITPEALRAVVADVVGRHASTTDLPSAGTPKPATKEGGFAEKLTRAKRALNLREFAEAEFFLDQATALEPRSSEANLLLTVLRKSRCQRDGPYRMLRESFPVGRPGRKLE